MGENVKYERPKDYKKIIEEQCKEVLGYRTHMSGGDDNLRKFHHSKNQEPFEQELQKALLDKGVKTQVDIYYDDDRGSVIYVKVL